MSTQWFSLVCASVCRHGCRISSTKRRRHHTKSSLKLDQVHDHSAETCAPYDRQSPFRPPAASKSSPLCCPSLATVMTTDRHTSYRLRMRICYINHAAGARRHSARQQRRYVRICSPGSCHSDHPLPSPSNWVSSSSSSFALLTANNHTVDVHGPRGLR